MTSEAVEIPNPQEQLVSAFAQEFLTPGYQQLEQRIQAQQEEEDALLLPAMRLHRQNQTLEKAVQIVAAKHQTNEPITPAEVLAYLQDKLAAAKARLQKTPQTNRTAYMSRGFIAIVREENLEWGKLVLSQETESAPPVSA